MIPFPFNENRLSFSFFFFLLQTIYQLASCVQIPRVIGAFSHVWKTMFNERDRRCTAVQIMCSTDPSYDNSTIASTLKMQIWIATNNRDMPRVMKRKFQLRLWSLVSFQVRATSCHLTSSKSACKSTPKCTWMCWRVWWAPSAIRWPVADPGCGSRAQRRPTSPKRPMLGFRRSASLTAPSSPDLNPLDYFVWSYVENITNMTSHNTKASLIAAIRRVFAELPPALVEKLCF